jgi:hypothetical protein
MTVIRAFRRQGLFEKRLQVAINHQCVSTLQKPRQAQTDKQQAYIITVSRGPRSSVLRELIDSLPSNGGLASDLTFSPTCLSWFVNHLGNMSIANTQLIAIFGSIFRNNVDPARFGVVLTYTLAAASLFANLVSLYAQVEQEMVRPKCLYQ